ncbi:50S ribosomal protein L16 [Ignicoccus islandicus DSM 13165]|uniref:Large ribosomal subunit protein uL16 n=1 Tax=Ignicoccus islandicus DSM 13165 TaxID=940295 RepID=A0A0U2VBP3_9CREN|nr:50S ribosomal protein L16 [Ignicoccus islandicus]ALU11522.1 50S ribosomal protein L16 [Ignicoccus islandicus DSM 13165]
MAKPARCFTKRHAKAFSGPPYTREEYIHGAPQPKVVKWVMGNPKVEAEVEIRLVALERAQIRHNALEAARVAVHKALSSSIGENNYVFIIKRYPHHVLREHKFMAFAGADRLQEGMRHAFGKPVGRAVRIYPGQDILVVKTKKQFADKAKEIMKMAAYKMPIPCRVEVIELSK